MKALFLLLLPLVLSKLILNPAPVTNDDYCDEFVDEAETSGCSYYSNLMFRCKSVVYNEEIFSSRVNDGICDCCDGSDESLLLNCPDVCETKASIALLELQKKQDLLMNGMKKNKEITEWGTRELSDIKLRYNANLEILKVYKETLQVEKSRLQQIESDALVVVIDFLKVNINEVAKMADFIAICALIEGESVIDSVIKIASGDNYDPDEAEALYLSMDQKTVDVSGDSNSFDKWNSNVDSMKAILQLDKVVNIEYLFTNVVKIIYSGSNLLKILNNNNLHVANLEIGGTKMVEKEDLLKSISNIEEKIRNIEINNKNIEPVISFDFGPDGYLYSLNDQCFTSVESSYTYELCVFKQVKQNGKTLLGRYRSHNIDRNNKRVVISYDQGDRCLSTAQKQARKFELVLECSGDKNELVNIEELEICSYRGVLRTSLGCFE